MTCDRCSMPCHGRLCVQCMRIEERGGTANGTVDIAQEDRFGCDECGEKFTAYVGEACPECGADAVSPLDMEGSR